MTPLRRLAAGLLAVAAVTTAARAEPVRVGALEGSFYSVTRAVVERVLERLGHETTVTSGAHAEVYAALGNGEIDLLVNAWLPHAHGHFWERYRDAATEIAVLYDGAALIWAVPGYVPQEMVASVSDLTKPEVRERMSPVIQGVGETTGIMTRSREMMETYGLDEAGYELRPGTPADRAAALAEAAAEERWLVVPLGTPMFLNPVYRLRRLEEPSGILGDDNEGVLLGGPGLAERVPSETLDVLRRLHLGRDAVEAMDVMVAIDGLSPEAAAEAWMTDNHDAVESWFAGVGR